MGNVINKGMKSPIPSYYGRLTTDPRELVNWIFGHGKKIDFDTAILPVRTLEYIKTLDDFYSFNKPMLKFPKMFYAGSLFDKAVYGESTLRNTKGELINHFNSMTLDIKIRLAN